MLYIGEKVGTGRAPRSTSRSIRSRAPPSPPRAAPNALAVMAMAEQATSSMRPTSTWTRSPSAAACRGRRRSRRDAGRQPQRPRQGQEGARSPTSCVCILDRPRHAELIAEVREAGAAHPADQRRRRGGRDRHLRPGDRHRHLHRLGRRAGGRAGGGGAALHRRPDAGPAAVPQRRRAGRARRTWASPTSTANTRLLDLAKGDVMFAATGVTDGSMLKGVRRFGNGAVDPFHRHALENRHGAVDFRPSQFLD